MGRTGWLDLIRCCCWYCWLLLLDFFEWVVDELVGALLAVRRAAEMC